MINNQLYSTISNNLQKNSNNYTNNEIFGLLSILVLLEITGIFQTDVKSLPESNSDSKENNILSSLGNIGNVGNLTGLLGQLQGNGSGNGDSGNNLQQMLPLLLGALGGNSGSGDMDIGKITNIMNALKNSQGDNSKEEHINVENEEIPQDDIDDGNDKKKVSAK